MNIIDSLIGLLSATSVSLIRVLLVALLWQRPNYDLRYPVNSQYDFIVVGSGSGGSTVATRLTEVEGLRVLLIEAGDAPPPESIVPGLASFSLLPKYSADWGYDTVRQKHGLKNLVNQAGRITQGKTVGGSSAINGLQWVRGSKQDFDHWAQLGNPGWDYKSILKYFQKAERYRVTPDFPTSRYYGTSGPISVVRVTPGPLAKAFIKGGQELGQPTPDDSNGPQQLGFSPSAVNIGDGRRSAAADTYLKTALERPNFHLLHSATVQQIIFDQDKRAVGVTLKHRGKLVTIRAKREVIVSAGAIGSPKLLLLSGVGPRNHLAEHGINLVADVPGVGQNLHDHINVMGLSWAVPKGLIPGVQDAFKPASIIQYIKNRAGPLASIPIEAPSSFVNVAGLDDPLWPDLQVFFNSLLPTSDFGLLYPSFYNLERGSFKRYFGDLLGQEGYSIRPVLLRPKSRGTIKLRSRFPDDPPLVDPNYLSHEDDVRVLVEGIKFSISLGNTSAFVRNYHPTFYEKPLAECAYERYASDGYWACYVRHMASTFLHLAGSCKMAPQSDPLGVVDHKLRVRGVKGLRVIDASIMPQVSTGNTNAPVHMIAEKASEEIKADWGI